MYIFIVEPTRMVVHIEFTTSLSPDHALDGNRAENTRETFTFQRNSIAPRMCLLSLLILTSVLFISVYFSSFSISLPCSVYGFDNRGRGSARTHNDPLPIVPSDP